MKIKKQIVYFKNDVYLNKSRYNNPKENFKFLIELLKAEKLNNILQPVHNSMFIESNPSPVKYAAKLLDLCDDNVRLPLVKVTAETKDIVKKALHSAKLV